MNFDQTTNRERRELLHHDVEIEILYCGICHSDLHQIINEFGVAMFPLAIRGGSVASANNLEYYFFHYVGENKRNNS